MRGNQIFLSDGSQITSQVSGSQVGGDITVQAREFLIDNQANVLTATFGTGNAGRINLNVSDSLKIVGTGFENFETVFIKGAIEKSLNINEASNNNTGLITGTEGSGTAGIITINTNQLSLEAGSVIGSASFGEGALSNLQINSNDSIKVVSSGIFNSPLTETTRIIRARNTIEANTKNLTIKDGGLITSLTLGAENASDIIINASEQINIVRTLPNSLVSTGIFSNSGFGNGAAGNITINTQSLNLQEGGQIISASGILTSEEFIPQGGKGGDIAINASETIEISGASSDNVFLSAIASTTFSNNDAGDLNISAEKITISDGAVIDASTINSGNGGNVTINASESIKIFGTSATNNQVSSSIASASGELALNIFVNPNMATGNAGDLSIKTQNLWLANGGRVAVNSRFAGDAGTLDIVADDLKLENGANISSFGNLAAEEGIKIKASNSLEIVGSGFAAFESLFIDDGLAGKLTPESLSNTTGIITGTERTGSAGNIKIETAQLRLLEGGFIGSLTFGAGNTGTLSINSDSLAVISSGIFNNPLRESAGNGNLIEINTSNLIIRDGGLINSVTVGAGEGGDINIVASEQIDLLGALPNSLVATGIFSNSGFDNGAAGNITINTQRLNLQDGGQIISASGILTSEEPITQGGKGGDIDITATESIEVSSSSSNKNRFFSTSVIAGNSFTNEDAGNISIQTDELLVSEGATIVVDSEFSGNTGTLEIIANSIKLDNGATFNASTVSGDRGNIVLQTEDLQLFQNSTITANAQNSDGGNINIDADLVFAFPNQNSDITASALQGGNGGNINITSEVVLGIQERPAIEGNITNDIDASSRFGLSGNVTLNAPDNNNFQEAADLSTEVISAEAVASNTCSVREGVSSLVIQGKGGVAPTPDAPLNADAILSETKPVTTNISQVNNQKTNNNNTLAVQPVATALGDIYPARGMIKTQDGRIILTAYANDDRVERETKDSPGC